MDVDARIEGLQAEIDRLQGRVDHLETVMGMRLVTPIGWGLTGSMMCVFGVLLARELATKDAIMAALYRNEGRDEAEIKIVDVFICKLRARLKPLDLSIETVWGRGYRMTPEHRARAAEMIREQGVMA